MHERTESGGRKIAAAASLSDARPNAVRALVLLSDGLANPAPASEVIAAAEAARAAGITL